jgi:hypothetical protein
VSQNKHLLAFLHIKQPFILVHGSHRPEEFMKYPEPHDIHIGSFVQNVQPTIVYEQIWH